MSSASNSLTIALIVVGALLVIGGVAAWSLGGVLRDRGYRFGKDTLVMCRDGHIFTTTWIPFASFSAIRLGWVRFQYCPVGRHWSFIKPIPSDPRP